MTPAKIRAVRAEVTDLLSSRRGYVTEALGQLPDLDEEQRSTAWALALAVVEALRHLQGRR